jgi:hypothetical protein
MPRHKKGTLVRLTKEYASNHHTAHIAEDHGMLWVVQSWNEGRWCYICSSLATGYKHNFWPFDTTAREERTNGED